LEEQIEEENAIEINLESNQTSFGQDASKD
jgi:hypothetical protein